MVVTQLSSARPGKKLRWTHGPGGLVRAYEIGPPAKSWPCVSTRTTELTVVLDGELTLSMGPRAQTLRARAGDLFMLCPRSPHVVVVERPVRLLVLDVLDGDPRLSSSMASVRHLPAARLPRRLHRSLGVIWSKPAHAALVELQELRTELSHRIAAGVSMPIEPVTSTRRIDGVKALLERAIDEPPSLRALAASAKADPYYVLRAFKRHTGFTPKAYVQFLRLERFVWSLFEDTRQRSLLTLSGEAGFDDYSSFRRRIREIFACAPSELLHRGPDRTLGPDA